MWTHLILQRQQNAKTIKHWAAQDLITSYNTLLGQNNEHDTCWEKCWLARSYKEIGTPNNKHGPTWSYNENRMPQINTLIERAHKILQHLTTISGQVMTESWQMSCVLRKVQAPRSYNDTTRSDSRTWRTLAKVRAALLTKSYKRDWSNEHDTQWEKCGAGSPHLTTEQTHRKRFTHLTLQQNWNTVNMWIETPEESKKYKLIQIETSSRSQDVTTRLEQWKWHTGWENRGLTRSCKEIGTW